MKLKTFLLMLLFVQCLDAKSVRSKVIPVGKDEKVSPKLTENDILVPSKLRNAFLRTAKWPTAVVPYTVDNIIKSDSQRWSALIAAFNEYHTKTCIKWIQRRSSDANYVKFVDSGPLICSSYVGMIQGPQLLSVGQGCERAIGVVLHEMAHALGFMHEHTRPDRDKYVTVVSEKILPGKGVMFDKIPANDTNLQNFAYDYNSILHYSSAAFSVDGSNTIVTADRAAQSEIGQRRGFSECDLEKINKLYGCTKYLKNIPSCLATEETKPTLPISSCSDDSNMDCSAAVQNPIVCQHVPGYYMFYCRRSCNNCDSNICMDTVNPFTDCTQARQPCDLSYGYSCPKTCGWCV